MREALRALPPGRLLELPCHAADGSPRVLLQADSLYTSQGFRFDAAGTLVGSWFNTFEGRPECGGVSEGVYYGETGGDCTFFRFRSPPPGCPTPDAGPHYECVLTDAGAGDQ
jgi:hypothetical protein